MTQVLESAVIMLRALQAQDEARPRSQQTQIGVSALGSCSRKVWLQLNGADETNEGDHLEAIMGTAIHGAIEKALEAYSFGTYKTELEVEWEGLKGHIDWYREDTFEVVDFKTMKLKNAGYFPKQSQMWQVHVYAYLLIKNGYRVDRVTLVAVMRDGGSDKVLEWSAPYDEAIALEAIAWLENIKTTDLAPAPEMDAKTFCQRYCEYFGENCMGKQTNKRRW